MARKGILSSDITTSPRRTADTPKAPRGAVGALQSSLTKLQENAVQEIDPRLIDDAGVEDRLGQDNAAAKSLKESLRTYGQQVPVLLRPHPERQGRYEIVYGRRRLKALKELEQPVKAMIRQLDDHDLVMAQGQENTARQELSFIEKASFAAQLDAMDYERQTIADALSIDMPMVSRLLKVGHAFPMPFLRRIGSAPSVGRDRWMDLARKMEDPEVHARVTACAHEITFYKKPSDDRFDAVMAATAAPVPKRTAAAKAKPRTLRGDDGTALGDIRVNSKGVTLSIPARNADGFDDWINSNAEALLAELHDRWKKRLEGS